MKSPFAKGCLGLFIILIAAGGYLFWRVKHPPKVGDDFSVLTAEQKKQRRADAEKLVKNIEDVATKIRSGDRSPFRLEASEPDLNTLLQDRIRTEKFALKNLRVGLDSNQLTLQGDVPYNGLETTATLVGSISAQDGKVRFNTQSLLIGGLLEAPKTLKRKIEKEVNKQLNKLLDGAKVNVTNALIEDKKLIIEGAPR